MKLIKMIQSELDLIKGKMIADYAKDKIKMGVWGEEDALELAKDTFNTMLKNGIETDMSLGGEFSDVIVPAGYVYVLGDNRISSADSRRFGCIPIEKIEGKAVFRWWPLKRAGKVK